MIQENSLCVTALQKITCSVFFASNLSKHIIIDTIRMARRQEKKADVHVCAGKAAAQPFLDIGPSIESSIMPCLCYKQAFFALIKKA